VGVSGSVSFIDEPCRYCDKYGYNNLNSHCSRGGDLAVVVHQACSKCSHAVVKEDSPDSTWKHVSKSHDNKCNCKEPAPAPAQPAQ